MSQRLFDISLNESQTVNNLINSSNHTNTIYHQTMCLSGQLTSYKAEKTLQNQRKPDIL